MGRQSVWSDAEIRQMVGHFVLAADEVWRLQGGVDFHKYREAGGSDPECLCFQDMAAAGHYGKGGGTKQGIYVCTPSGTLLASINSLSAKAVKQMLERALAAWNELPDEARRAEPPVSKPEHRWEWNYPENGLVLKQTARYLSEDSVEDQQPDSRFNFDFAWFSADEAAQFISEQPIAGEHYELPQDLYERFARYHLLNTAHGESGTYRADEVNGKLSVKVLEADQQTVRIRLSGISHQAASKNNVGHGRASRIAAELLGFASYDRTTRRFTRFELVAKGKIYKTVEFQPDERHERSIGWYFTLANPDNAFERLYPTQIYAYDANWVQKPTLALHGLKRNEPVKNSKLTIKRDGVMALTSIDLEQLATLEKNGEPLPISVRVENGQITSRYISKGTTARFVVYERAGENSWHGVYYLGDEKNNFGVGFPSGGAITWPGLNHKQALQRQLERAGLPAAEAESLLERHEREWFREGIRVFYVLDAGSAKRTLAEKIPADAKALMLIVEIPNQTRH